MNARRLAPAALTIAALTLSACSSAPAADPAATATAATVDDVSVVSPAEGKQVLDAAPAGLVVLDVRTPAEFAEGHLPDAVNIDLQGPAFRDQVAQLERSAPVLLYCRSGNRSATARQVMVELGFERIADVDGGIVAWQQAGLPVVG